MARASKVVVVTGASAGVGRAAALAFAARGDRVGLIARSEAGLRSTAEEIARAGGQAIAHAADVSDIDALRAAADAIETALGPIDVWVNDAMVTVLGPVDQLRAEEIRRVTEVTYLGTVHGTMVALERMGERGRGKIIQVGSALAYRSVPLQAPYCAAKAAIRGFTDSLRCELIHQKSPVSVTIVHMPGLNTPQFSWARVKFKRHPQPVPPIFQPELAGRAIAFAADRSRREIWVGFSTVQAILGNRVAPALLDRMMSSKAWEGQFTDEPTGEDRPDNLFEAVDGLHRTRGAFDERAKSGSVQFWLERFRLTDAAAVLGILLGLTLTVAGVVGLVSWL
jgi:short-subunit dehydrogenase